MPNIHPKHVKSFEELKVELLDRIKVRGCTHITVTGYRYLFKLSHYNSDYKQRQNSLGWSSQPYLTYKGASL